MNSPEHALIRIAITIDGREHPTEIFHLSGEPERAFDRAIGALVDASTDYAPGRDGGTGRSLRAVPDPDETA